MGLAGGLATNGIAGSGGGGGGGVTTLSNSDGYIGVSASTGAVVLSEGATLASTLALLAPLANPTFTGTVTLPAGSIAQAALATQTIVSSQQSGTTYTLALTDQDTVVETTSATAVTITIPTNASVAFPVGTVIEIFQDAAGQVTVAAAGGVTLRTPSSATTRVQYSTIGLRQRAANEWVLSGDLT